MAAEPGRALPTNLQFPCSVFLQLGQTITPFELNSDAMQSRWNVCLQVSFALERSCTRYEVEMRTSGVVSGRCAEYLVYVVQADGAHLSLPCR